MRKKCVRLLAVILFAIVLNAQDPETGELRGELRRDQTLFFDHLLVALYDFGSHQEFMRAMVSPDGSFILRRVPAGEFLLRVTTETGDVIQEQRVVMRQNTQPVEIRLPAEHPQLVVYSKSCSLPLR